MFWPVDETREALSESTFLGVPNEILFKIFRYFSVRDLCHVSLTCRAFKMIADHDQFWKPKCNTTIKLHSKSYRQIYIEWMHEKSLRKETLLKTSRVYYRQKLGCIMCPPSYELRPTNKPEFQFIAGFYQHPNSTQEKTIDLSVDIETSAFQLISLLEKANPFKKQWQQTAVLKQMIQRYYRFMQLKASNPPDTLLIPTLDIEMVWQTHLLRPKMYRSDCLRLFHRIIDHSLVVKSEMEDYFKDQAFLDTCRLYEQRFGTQYCSLSSIEEKLDDQSIYSYWDKTSFEFSPNPPNDYENPFSFTEGDFIVDGKWLNFCKQFLFNVSKKVSSRGYYPYARDRIRFTEGTMKRLRKSYERFLYMAAKYPLTEGNGFIPPTYAIDIIWHAHMQEPLNYAADCLRLVGYIIYHDPWPIIEDETMNKSCDQVNQIWKDEFGCDLETDHLYNTSDYSATD